MMADARHGCTRIVYDSETLARNAATLHLFARPECTSITGYPCRRRLGDGVTYACPPDTWHIGHSNRAQGVACREAGPIDHHPPPSPRTGHPTPVPRRSRPKPRRWKPSRKTKASPV